MPTTMDMIGSDKSLQEHWVKRIVACIIDAVIIYLIALVLWIPISIFTILTWSWLHVGVPFLFFAGAIWWLYSALMEGSSGATIGKRFLNLRVAALQGEMEIGRGAVRNLSKIHPIFLLIDLILGIVTEGDPKQRYMDRIAGTTVSAVTPAPPAPYQSPMPSPPQPYAPQAGAPEPYSYDVSQSYEYRAPQPAPKPQLCAECGGRLILTGDGRQQCIRCGKVY
ncbi:MAG: RDD family protein [Candidatus Thermoplasmatota archaeon]